MPLETQIRAQRWLLALTVVIFAILCSVPRLVNLFQFTVRLNPKPSWVVLKTSNLKVRLTVCIDVCFTTGSAMFHRTWTCCLTMTFLLTSILVWEAGSIFVVSNSHQIGRQRKGSSSSRQKNQKNKSSTFCGMQWVTLDCGKSHQWYQME